MQKDFEKWMPVKATINGGENAPRYKEGCIYWISIGANVGHEEDGKGKLFARPVLVIRGFNRRLFWGIPLTTAHKTGKYYYDLGMIKGKHNSAMLSQLRVFDAARISGRDRLLAKIKTHELNKIKDKLHELL